MQQFIFQICGREETEKLQNHLMWEKRGHCSIAHFFPAKKKIFSNFYFYWHLLQDYIKASINVFSQFLLLLGFIQSCIFFQLLENFAIIQYPWCTYWQYFPKYTGHLRYLGIKRDRTSEEHYINIINRPGSEPRLAHARECQI